jgi:hypothetical protein
MGEKKDYELVLKAHPGLRGGRVTVLVYDQEDNLLTTHEGNLISLTARAKVAIKLAEALGFDQDQAKALRAELDIQWLEFYRLAQAQAGPAQQSAADLLAQMPGEAVREADEMLNDPALITRIGDDIADLGVAGERHLCLTLYLLGVSRQLTRPLSVRVHGPSSSGKSHLSKRSPAFCRPKRSCWQHR